ncbi:MAG: 1-deoxy-D-xylulose-5-phosphate reductoisomerase, partial [Phycisphaerae bacterium]|nr:1-deoxy-D-xylulose-5-phosphate reductoisomerase [Phycisphaerae bacterium]
MGTSVLAVIESMPSELAVRSLAARHNWQAVAEQVRRHKPVAVAMADPEAAEKLRRNLNGSSTLVLSGPAAMTELAADPSTDVVVCAVVGAAGLAPALAAARSAKTVALANKEALVVGGDLLMDEVRRHNATLLPVDSEHSAVFQAVQAGR